MKYSDFPRIICELYLTKMSQPYISSAELLDRLNHVKIETKIVETPKKIEQPIIEKKNIQIC